MDDRSERKAAAADAFGASADGYLASETHGEGADLDRLASWCAGATRALDVATGAGHTAGALVETGVPTVVACDASPAMVATAVASVPDVAGVVGDAERLPFRTDAFDAVTCRIAAHHFPDPEAFVAEVARVLRPGGVLAFEDNVAPEDDALASFLNRLERLRDPTHVESYATATWHGWFAEAGFAVEETDHVTKPIEFEPWLDRTGMLDTETGAEIEGLLLDASGEVAEFFAVRRDEGAVESFGSPKALIRARRRE